MLPIRAFERSETGRRDHNEDAFLLDEEHGLFAVGRVQVTKADTPLVELRKGGYFGELILFDGAPRSATVTATEETMVVAIERDGLTRLLQRDVELAAKLLWSIGRVMAGRLRSTTYSLTAQS